MTEDYTFVCTYWSCTYYIIQLGFFTGHFGRCLILVDKILMNLFLSIYTMYLYTDVHVLTFSDFSFGESLESIKIGQNHISTKPPTPTPLGIWYLQQHTGS